MDHSLFSLPLTGVVPAVCDSEAGEVIALTPSLSDYPSKEGPMLLVEYSPGSVGAPVLTPVK